MHLSRSLATTVLGPVHTVGDQCNGRGVDGMNRLLKAAGQAAVATRRSELRIKRLEMLKDSPKQLLHHVTVAELVGVRERVAAWWAPHHESLQVLRHGGEGYHGHRSAQSHG